MDQLRLFHDLTGEIETTETADLHSHLHWTQPSAQSLAHLLSYHFLQNEIRAAGAPDAVFRLEDREERFRALLPWFARIANVGTSYSLRRILKDLYGMKEETVGPENADWLAGRVAERAADPEWTREVLRRHARLRRVFVSTQLESGGQDPEWKAVLANTPEAARGADLFHLAGETGFVSDQYLSWAMRPYGRRRYPPAASARDWMDRQWSFVNAGNRDHLKSLMVWINVRIRHFPGGMDEVEPLAEAAWRRGVENEGIGLSPDEGLALRMYGLYAMIKNARDAGLPLQIFLGSVNQGGDRGPWGGWQANHVDYDPSTLREFGCLVHDNPGVRFDFLQGCVQNGQELAIMAKMRPNVGLCGIWWHSMYPAYLRRILSERLDAVPLTKTCLFFSDAYMAEWCYGKRRLVEREFAYVLAERVAFGYFSRADASRVIHAWMRENPARVYGVAELAGPETA